MTSAKTLVPHIKFPGGYVLGGADTFLPTIATPTFSPAPPQPPICHQYSVVKLFHLTTRWCGLNNRDLEFRGQRLASSTGYAYFCGKSRVDQEDKVQYPQRDYLLSLL